MDTRPFSASKTDNWVARAGGLSDYIRGVAHALMRERGITDESKAIQMAWGIMRNWASGQGHVHPQVQAAAAKAVAEMDAKRAATAGRRLTSTRRG